MNAVLSTEAHVRLVRALSLSSVPIGARELSSIVAMQPAGVARACARLEDLGVLESVGRSRTRLYQLSARFAFREQLIALFAEEKARGIRILEAVRGAVGYRDDVISAWIEGPVATASDAPGDPITVGVLVSAGDASRIRPHLWAPLLKLQREWGVEIELRIETEADLLTASPERLAALVSVILLRGVPPSAIVRARSRGAMVADRALPTHADLDLRRQRIARALAEKLKTDPSIVESAKRYVDERLLTTMSGERLELEEWRDILETYSVSRLRRFLASESQRATRLRQSLPFMDVFTEAERRHIIDTPGQAP